MATPVQVTALVNRVRQTIDVQTSSRFTFDEIVDYLNLSLGEFHDLLTLEHEDYFTEYVDLSLTGSVYQLSSSVYKVSGVDRIVNSNDLVPLRRVGFQERGNRNTWVATYDSFYGALPSYTLVKDTLRFMPATTQPGSVRLWFVPQVRPLVTGSNASLSTPYTINGWEEYIVLGASIQCLIKDNRDASQLVAKQAKLEARIKNAASGRDAGGQERVQHVARDDDDWFW